MAAITTKDEAKTGKPATDDSQPPPWHAAYQPPQNFNPASISRAELLQLLLLHYSSDGHENKNQKKKNFVLIDLRRMDHEVSSVLDRMFFFKRIYFYCNVNGRMLCKMGGDGG